MTCNICSTWHIYCTTHLILIYLWKWNNTLSPICRDWLIHRFKINFCELFLLWRLIVHTLRSHLWQVEYVLSVNYKFLFFFLIFFLIIYIFFIQHKFISFRHIFIFSFFKFTINLFSVRFIRKILLNFCKIRRKFFNIIIGIRIWIHYPFTF